MFLVVIGTKGRRCRREGHKDTRPGVSLVERHLGRETGKKPIFMSNNPCIYSTYRTMPAPEECSDPATLVQSYLSIYLATLQSARMLFQNK